MSKGRSVREPARTRLPRYQHLAAKSLIALAVLVAGVAGVALLAVFVFPTQQYFDQRDRIEHSEQVLERLRTETERLSGQVAAAQDPVAVERNARERLSLVRAGDTLYQLDVDPANSVRLPNDWPLVGVRYLLGAN